MTQRLRWGVMSTANIAQMVLIPAIQQSTFGTVEVLASRDIEKARSVASSLGISRAVGSYEALLEDPNVDAVYIPLPNSLHAEWTVRAAEAGKAVLCEKPMGISSDEVKRQIETCAKCGVSLMEGFMYRFHPQTRRIQELITSGVIGQVRHVDAHLSVNIMQKHWAREAKSHLADADADLSDNTMQPVDVSNIRYRDALGGGTLLDMGCYTVNISRMVFRSEPRRVFGRLDIDPRLGVDTSAAGILEFAEGMATISCSFKADGQGYYRIVGTEGSIEAPRGIIPGLGTRASEGLVIVVDADGNRREEVFEPVNQYSKMVDAFSEAVLNRRPVPLPPEDSLNNIKVLEALSRSSAKNIAEVV